MQPECSIWPCETWTFTEAWSRFQWQAGHMRLKNTSAPSNTHTNRMNDIPTLQEISRKFHHVARKPWSGWCCSGVRISRFDSSALCFQSQGLRVHWENQKTLLSCALHTLYLLLLALSIARFALSTMNTWGHEKLQIKNKSMQTLYINHTLFPRTLIKLQWERSVLI